MKEILEMLHEVSDIRKAEVLKLYDIVREEFMTKPAAVKHHHIEAGGLGRHTKEVMNIALSTYLVNPECYDCLRDEVVISAFVHDLGKIGRYKDLPPGDWRRQEKYGAQKFEYNNLRVVMSDAADVAVFCFRNGLNLTDKEINAVTFAHGGWSVDAVNNSQAMKNMTSLAVLIHFADLMSVKAFDKRIK